MRKLTRKMKEPKDAILEGHVLECMLSLFDTQSTSQMDDEQKALSQAMNRKIADLFNNNDVFYDWMATYIPFCLKLKSPDVRYLPFYENLHRVLRGVALTVRHAADSNFYLMYNATKKKQFGYLVKFVEWKKKRMNVDKLLVGSCDVIQMRIQSVTVGMDAMASLAQQEQGRRFLLEHDNGSLSIIRNLGNVLRLEAERDRIMK